MVEFILKFGIIVLTEDLNMKIDTNNIFSISEANQNFSKIAKAVDKNGCVVILKNNKPKYIIQPFDSAKQ